METKDLKEKAKSLFSSKDFLKTLFFGLSVLAIIVLLAALLLKDVTKESYGVLYTNLSPDDAGKILSVLQEEKIPYKIEGGGSIILVPKDKIYEVRLKLAAKGLPSSNVVGFELFDEPKMGATRFQENINYIRAIEGELTRTIKKIDAIKDAKVNIALPQDSIFAREEDEAKASVVVSLWPGKDLTKEQVKAIVFLVSHAVPKLKAENVTVVDNRGRVLSDLIEEDEGEVKDIVDIKRRIRREIEKSVQSMLARALGPQKVVVRASVDVETAQVNKEDEIYDPDRVAVVSERKIQEKSKGVDNQAAGAPGTTTNVPATINNGNQNILLEKSKKDITTNYDVTKSLIRTKQNIFKIKRLSVGVLIDGKYIRKEVNGTVKVEFVPRSEAEIKAYEQLIKTAVGFDEARGDKVTVISVPFETVGEEKSLTSTEDRKKEYLLFGLAGAGALAVLGGLLFYSRRKAKKKEQELEEKLAKLNQAQEAAQVAAGLQPEGEVFSLEKEPVYRKVLEIAEENPEIVAEMLRRWIKEEK